MMSWAEAQKYIKQKSPHCPICKHETVTPKSEYIQIKRQTSQYIASDGKVFPTMKELIKYNRQLKIANSPHEQAIENICLNTKYANKYKFKKSVIFSIAKWNYIWELRADNKLKEDELPAESQIRKEIHKLLCPMCDGDPSVCECDEGSYTFYSFVEKELGSYIKFIPDVYAIDQEDYVISVYEVEDTHRVSIAKLIQYAIFADCLDWYFPEWEFNLYIHDRFGNRMGAINLPVYYNAGLFPDIVENYLDILEECETFAERIEGELIGYFRTAKFQKY